MFYAISNKYKLFLLIPMGTVVSDRNDISMGMKRSMRLLVVVIKYKLSEKCS